MRGRIDDRNIDLYTVSMTPDPSTLTPGDMFTVTVSADCEANAVVGGIFFEGKTVTMNGRTPTTAIGWWWPPKDSVTTQTGNRAKLWDIFEG